MNRKEFFFTLFKKTVSIAFDNPIINAIEKVSITKERPPGSLPEKEFLEKCTGCDACMIACPVNVIMIEDLEARKPVIYPDKDPCILCKDTPCITSCPTGALTLSKESDKGLNFECK